MSIDTLQMLKKMSHKVIFSLLQHVNHEIMDITGRQIPTEYLKNFLKNCFTVKQMTLRGERSSFTDLF